MKRRLFGYDLPADLIAQYPPPRRGDSRLLHLQRETGALSDRHFSALPGFLRPGDLLVFNDTRVIPARLFARKESGGRVEILLERVVDENHALAQVRASKSPQAGTLLQVTETLGFQVDARQDDFFVLSTAGATVADLLQAHGHVPLPPYITRADQASDVDAYQTVFARNPGAVAAPTAGLHFTEELLAAISDQGVALGYITLHVGAGTFQPVRCEDIEEHRLHRERFVLSAELCAQIEAARKKGGRVIAVGTTTVRTLEAAALAGPLQPQQGETDLFIHPGFEFRVVDGLLTNFHLPESSLLMLVCAFAGRDQVLSAYGHAVAAGYRFFSYGDAMFIE